VEALAVKKKTRFKGKVAQPEVIVHEH